jgi:hypothetical protein
MIFPRAILAALFACILSLNHSAQALPGGFIFDNAGQLIYQVKVDHTLLPEQVEEYGSYQAVGLAVQVIDNIFAVVLVNAQPEKGDLLFKKQKKDPITLNVDGETIMGGSYRKFDSKKVGKMRYEAIVIQIEREDFEKLLAANKVFVDYGKFSHLVSAENLKAFHYLSDRLEKDELPGETTGAGSSSSSTEIHVKGYFRRDGTYVKPHIRKRPKN